MRTRTSSGPTSRVLVDSTIRPSLEPLKTVKETISARLPEVREDKIGDLNERRLVGDARVVTDVREVRLMGNGAREGSYMRKT
jgi:hypothetical protein